MRAAPAGPQPPRADRALIPILPAMAANRCRKLMGGGPQAYAARGDNPPPDDPGERLGAQGIVRFREWFLAPARGGSISMALTKAALDQGIQGSRNLV